MDDLERLKKETEEKKLKFQNNVYGTVNKVYEAKNRIKEGYNSGGWFKKLLYICGGFFIFWLILVLLFGNRP